MKPSRVLAIQYLRGIAAILVVVHHTTNPAAWLFNPLEGFDLGGAGVDIFFVISGFIMVTIGGSQSFTEFVWKRITRIVPLYWLFTLLFVLVQSVFVPHAIAGWNITHVVRSLLFIPYESPIYPGENWPLLVPGWTLNFEMFFYALFAIGILIRRTLATLCATIIPLVVLGFILRGGGGPVLETYSSPLLLEFLAGAVIGQAALAGLSFDRWWPLLPVGVVAMLILASPQMSQDLRALFRIFPAVAIVVGALALERLLQRRPSRVLELLGDASYSIYLSHILTLQLVLAVAKRLPISGWPQFLGVVATSLAGCILVGILVHLVIERRLGTIFSRRRALLT